MPATAKAPSYEAFERLKSQGLLAYKGGDYAKAKPFLMQAADYLLRIAENGPDGDVRTERQDLAQQLIGLAKECEAKKGKPKKKKRAKNNGGDDDEGADASDWIVREKPDISFDDIAGLADVKDEIRLKMIYPLEYAEEAAEYGISAGGGLLVYGPPGTGKTMIAKAVANEIDATFFMVSPAEMLSKWVGEAEQNISKLFDAAKAEEKAVIFVDEIEALAPRRGSGGSTVMQRVVPQMLQELEGFDRGTDRCLLFIGATNKPWMLDDAMMRPGRFDTMAYLGLPDAAARMRMLEIYFGDRPLDDGIDFGKLCGDLDGYSGADIKNLAKKSAAVPFMAFVNSGGEGERRPIAMGDILSVLEGMQPSVKPRDLKRYDKFTETGK